MNSILPKNILNIISTINKGGYEAHIVGGCVRDMLLNRTPSDWDVTTNADPEAIKALFPKTFDTGIQHGTVTVLLDGMPVEVTVWRKETGYSDHRRPDAVMPTNSLEEDLSRRDFTINAMAFHPQQGLIDPFNGLEDMERKIIRCVGNPLDRFSEDALRMLRAIRFSAQLDFEIETSTLSGIEKLAEDIVYISKERIQAELNKILESSAPQRLGLLWKTRLNKMVFPRIENLPSGWRETIRHFMGSEYQKCLLLVLLFHLSCKTGALSCAEEYLRTYKYDNKTRRQITSHIKCLDGIEPLTPRNIRKTASEYGTDATRNILEILSILKPGTVQKQSVSPDSIDAAVPVHPAISGVDLKDLGLEGRAIKDMLDILRHCLFERPDLNTKEILMNLAKNVLFIYE